MTEKHPDWPSATLGSDGKPTFKISAPEEADVVEAAAHMIRAGNAKVVIETVPPYLKTQIEGLVHPGPQS